MTALQLGLLAHATGAQLGRADGLLRLRPSQEEHGERRIDALDEVTRGLLRRGDGRRARGGGLSHRAGLRRPAARGTLWGGNLCDGARCSARRTGPRSSGGVLFLEDVNEHPYRVERSLLQLQQAGVLGAQKAVLLGAFSDWKPRRWTAATR